jgi:hypothetical protein
VQRILSVLSILQLIMSFVSIAHSDTLNLNDRTNHCSPYELFSNKVCEPFTSYVSDVDKKQISNELNLKKVFINSGSSLWTVIRSDRHDINVHQHFKSETSDQDIFKSYLSFLFPTLKINEPTQVINLYDSPPWQNAINILLKNIYTSNQNENLLKNFLCKSIHHESQISRTLGITDPEVVRKIYTQCLNHMGYLTESNQYLTKFYVIVKIEEDDKFPYTGWTSESNITFLFIKKNTTWADLTASLIHELAVVTDSKSSHNHFWTDRDDQKIKLILSTQCTAIKSALITLRANKLMMAGLGKTIFPIQDAIQRDQDKENFKSLVNLYSNWNNYSNETLSAGEYKYNCNQLDKIADDIVNSKIELRTIQGEVVKDFFNYLTTPEIASKSIYSHGAHGPGCGYCGGSNKPEGIDTEWNAQMVKSQ